jgi:hypothetical protein
MERIEMKKIIVILVVFLTACASVDEPEKKSTPYEKSFVGNHVTLALCMTKRLQMDRRWSMRMLQFRNRIYQDTEVSEILAYDMRLLPGIYARNSPTNPDAVMDHVSPTPEVAHTYDRTDKTYFEPAYRFSLIMKGTDTTAVTAKLKGNQHLGSIAWKHLQVCAHPI